MKRRYDDYLSRLVGIRERLHALCGQVLRERGKFAHLDVVRAKLHLLAVDQGENGVDAAFQEARKHNVSRQTADRWMKFGIEAWVDALSPAVAKRSVSKQRRRWGRLIEIDLQWIGQLWAGAKTEWSWRQLADEVHNAALNDLDRGRLRGIPHETLWRHRQEIIGYRARFSESRSEVVADPDINVEKARGADTRKSTRRAVKKTTQLVTSQFEMAEDRNDWIEERVEVVSDFPVDEGAGIELEEAPLRQDDTSIRERAAADSDYLVDLFQPYRSGG